jgi:hypothetical protein
MRTATAMAYVHALQIISRDEQTPVPPTDALKYPEPLEEYEEFDLDNWQDATVDKKQEICVNVHTRMAGFRARLKSHNVCLKNINVYAPILQSHIEEFGVNISQWNAVINNMLRQMIPTNATYEKDPVGTETWKKKTMELDHVIPISWVWTHRQYFEADPARVNIITGWYNVLPIPFAMNRRKSNYTPSADDIEINIKNKTEYFKTIITNTDQYEEFCTTVLTPLEELYSDVYDEIVRVIEETKSTKK